MVKHLTHSGTKHNLPQSDNKHNGTAIDTPEIPS